MITVKLRNNPNDLVEVRITVETEGNVRWSYKYESEERKKITGASDRANTGPNALGRVHELKDDINGWEFILVNLDEEDAGYSIIIEWIQDGETVQEAWRKEGKLKKDKPVFLRETALLYYN